MMSVNPQSDWSPQALDPSLPVYLAIVEALESDILSGRLKAGEKLPPQRQLAQAIGVDLTTISRAYQQARARELVVAQVGKGTFVHASGQAGQEVTPYPSRAVREIDMGMNIPPLPDDARLVGRMKREMSQAVARMSTSALFGYHDFVGSLSDRKTAARWVARRYEHTDAHRLLIGPGTQSVLLAMLIYLIKDGMSICSEYLAYPGFKSLCQRLKVNCIGLPLDGEGICPDAFREACCNNRVRLLYCTPTMHNPTSLTWSARRRQEIADIAREYDVLIVEDDAYGFITAEDCAPLSSCAPERSFHIAGFAKCVSSGLRVSFVSVPDANFFQGLSMAMRATSMMVAATSRAMAIQLLTSGCADEITEAIKQEARARQEILQKALIPGSYSTNPDGFHAWLTIPDHLSTADFVTELRSRSIRVVPADVFVLPGHPPPNAVRVCLGVPENRTQCRAVLEEICDVYLNGTQRGETFV